MADKPLGYDLLHAILGRQEPVSKLGRADGGWLATRPPTLDEVIARRANDEQLRKEQEWGAKGLPVPPPAPLRFRTNVDFAEQNWSPGIQALKDILRRGMR